MAEIQFMGFLYKCADQLVAQAGQIRARTWGQVTAPLVVRTAYGGGVRTPEHHSDSLEGLLIGSPGVKVVVPSTPLEAAGLLLSAIDDPDPVVMMEPIRLYRATHEALPTSSTRVPLGQARVRRSGNRRDADRLGGGGAAGARSGRAGGGDRGHRGRSHRSAHAVAARLGHAGGLGREDGPAGGSARGAAVRAGRAASSWPSLVERCFYALRSPPQRVAGADVVYPPQLLEDAYLPDAGRIADGAARWRWKSEVAFEFKLPDLGEGIHEAQVLAWKVAPGQQVAAFQALCEVESAKAAVELTAPVAGRVRETRFRRRRHRAPGRRAGGDRDGRRSARRSRGDVWADPTGATARGGVVRHRRLAAAKQRSRRPDRSDRQSACAPRRSCSKLARDLGVRSRTCRARVRMGGCASPTSTRDARSADEQRADGRR